MEEVLAKLEKVLTLDHFGYGRYVEKGAIVPGESLLAPQKYFEEGYGDCDVQVNYIINKLIEAGIDETQIEIWLLNLPYLIAEESTFLEHTLTAVRQGRERFFLGYSPYDFLVTGQLGPVPFLLYPILSRSRIAQCIRKIISVKEFQQRFDNKIKKRYLWLEDLEDEEIRLRIKPKRNAVAVVEYKEICRLGAPAAWSEQTETFIEFGVHLGVNYKRKTKIVGYKYRLFRDLFNQARKILTSNAVLDVFFVLDYEYLPHFQQLVASWSPKEVLAKLLDAKQCPDYVEARIEQEFQREKIIESIEQYGESLYYAIINTFIPGKTSLQKLINRLR